MSRVTTHVSLEDKYNLSHGDAFVTGVQALVQLLVTQHRQDRSEGRVGRRTGHRLPGVAARRAGPGAATAPRCPRRERDRPPAGGQRGNWRPRRCWAASWWAGWRRHASTGWSACGTERRPASTGRPMPSATPTTSGVRPPVACSPSSATTRGPSPPRSPRRPRPPWPPSNSPPSTRPTRPRWWSSASTGTPCRACRDCGWAARWPPAWPTDPNR